MNRRDATSAEKSKRTKVLSKMRNSPHLHCDDRRENGNQNLCVFRASAFEHARGFARAAETLRNGSTDTQGFPW